MKTKQTNIQTIALYAVLTLIVLTGIIIGGLEA